jgi:hypothetical protein
MWQESVRQMNADEVFLEVDLGGDPCQEDSSLHGDPGK